MKLTLLGTGTPTPSLKRMSAGYLLEVGDARMLFDFGPGCYHRMMEAGIRAVDITHVFFTHLHYDHCLDFVRLLMTRWDQGGGKLPELQVFGPAHTAQMTNAIIAPDGLFGPDIKARTELPMSQAVHRARGGDLPRLGPAPIVRELKSGECVDGEGWQVKLRAVRHAQPVLECFGYRLEHAGQSFVYSGDSGPCKAMELLAADCDVLVHMCHFISGTELNEEMAENNMGHLQLARLGQASAAKNVVISHVTEQMDVPGVRENILRTMGEIYSGNLFFGEDLMQIPMDGPKPVRLD
ncbi:MAG: ribonuclease Z [Gammaproteobacteria bacterium]|jgi:ribonuclease Z